MPSKDSLCAITKLDEMKRETTFPKKDRLEVNIMTDCLGKYVGIQSNFHALVDGET